MHHAFPGHIPIAELVVANSQIATALVDYAIQGLFTPGGPACLPTSAGSLGWDGFHVRLHESSSIPLR